MECSSFKVLIRLVTERLQVISENVLPDEQFGFRPVSCTLHSLTKLLNNIEGMIRWPKSNLYAIFIDFIVACRFLAR